MTDPAGSATPQTGDFTTTYTNDSTGQLLTSTDANTHTTTYSNYDAVGYPKTTTDALNNATDTVYDVRGNVLSVTDALGKTSSYTYDVFGRSLTKKQPKDQAAGIYINTPAPAYDANDNVTQTTAPNGAVTAYEYDKVDRMSASIDPRDNPTDTVAGAAAEDADLIRGIDPGRWRTIGSGRRSSTTSRWATSRPRRTSISPVHELTEPIRPIRLGAVRFEGLFVPGCRASRLDVLRDEVVDRVFTGEVDRVVLQRPRRSDWLQSGGLPIT